MRRATDADREGRRELNGRLFEAGMRDQDWPFLADLVDRAGDGQVVVPMPGELLIRFMGDFARTSEAAAQRAQAPAPSGRPRRRGVSGLTPRKESA